MHLTLNIRQNFMTALTAQNMTVNVKRMSHGTATANIETQLFRKCLPDRQETQLLLTNRATHLEVSR